MRALVCCFIIYFFAGIQSYLFVTKKRLFLSHLHLKVFKPLNHHAFRQMQLFLNIWKEIVHLLAHVILWLNWVLNNQNLRTSLVHGFIFSLVNFHKVELAVYNASGVKVCWIAVHHKKVSEYTTKTRRKLIFAGFVPFEVWINFLYIF